MGRRQGQVPVHLSHEEAVRYLVDYNFSRLSPELNAAIKAHVRSCQLCQRQGLRHAPTKKRVLGWGYRFFYLTLQLAKYLRAAALVALVLAVLSAVGISALHHDPLYLASALGVRELLPSQNSLPATTIAQQPTPSLLAATERFETVGVQASAIAVAPDGRLAAAAGKRSGTPILVIYNALDGKAQGTLPWPGQDVPGTLAWSSNGDALAACDGTTLAIWQMPSRTLEIAITVSTQPGLRVYDVTSGAVVHTLDARTAFAAGTLLHWGADGQLSPAPAGAAGPSGVAREGNPLVGLWQVSGSRMFIASGAGVVVGFDARDYAHGLLAWAPDESYVLWGGASQPVAATQGSATPSAGAEGQGAQAPDSVVAAAASRLSQTRHGDVLIWFAPDGNSLAVCDRRAKGASLAVYSVDLDQAIAVIPQTCDNLNISSLSWMPAGRAFLLAAPNHPITLYPIASTVG